jgi:hypothetical protein
VVWVVGLRLDARAAVKPGTRRFLRLRAGPLAEAPSPGPRQCTKEAKAHE